MMRDAAVFYSRFDDPVAWQNMLQAELPDLGFHVHPDVGDPATVRYALIWKPPAGFFAAFPNLELVVALGAGVDSLATRDDVPDVPVSRLSDRGMVSLMTSYVHFAVIRHARGISAFERAQRRHEWKYVHPYPLSATKVGILGLGELGSAAAASLAQLGFDVTGWARTQKTIPGVQCVTGRAALDDVLAGNEIVVILLPLTHETRGLIGVRELALLPHGAKLINAARGAIVDEAALLDALRSGQVGEATLDTHTVEPLPPEHPFWDMENVLITPHIASITFPEGAARDVVESIRRVRAGAKPLHPVDLRRGY